MRNAADLGVLRRRRRVRPRPARHRPGRATCCAPWPSTRGVVARAAELREPHRVARYLEATSAAFHQFYDPCRVLPQGDEDTADLSTAPASCWWLPRAKSCQRPCAVGRFRPGPDVKHAITGRSAAGPPAPQPAGCACPRMLTRWCPHLWAASVSKVDGVLTVAGLAAPDLRGRVRHAAVRPRRGRLPYARPRLSGRLRGRAPTSTTPARRSSASRSRGGSPRRA